MSGTNSTYKIPTLKSILAKRSNGVSVVSTFSGCGGSSLGYKIAKCNVLYSVEFIKAAADVYRLNFPNVTVDERDIREIKGSEILKTINMKPGDLDILDGSPPCSGFSQAGIRDKGWGVERKYSDKKQRVDDLFFEYIRLIREIHPKVFVAENVAGLARGVAQGYFKKIFKAMQKCGYQVQAKLLDAKLLGVPQSRPRIIFIGVRNDLKKSPVYPMPEKKIISIKQALPHIEYAQYAQYARGNVSKESKWVPHNKAYAIHTGPMSAVLSRPDKYLQVGPVLQASGGEYGFSPVKSINEPSPTIGSTNKFGNGRMPNGTLYSNNRVRSLTIEELKTVCSFPHDFKLTGSFAQQWERLGRAVPPIMMSKIAKTIVKEIFGK